MSQDMAGESSKILKILFISKSPRRYPTSHSSMPFWILVSGILRVLKYPPVAFLSSSGIIMSGCFARAEIVLPEILFERLSVIRQPPLNLNVLSM